MISKDEETKIIYFNKKIYSEIFNLSSHEFPLSEYLTTSIPLPCPFRQGPMINIYDKDKTLITYFNKKSMKCESPLLNKNVYMLNYFSKIYIYFNDNFQPKSFVLTNENYNHNDYYSLDIKLDTNQKVTKFIFDTDIEWEYTSIEENVNNLSIRHLLFLIRLLIVQDTNIKNICSDFLDLNINTITDSYSPFYSDSFKSYLSLLEMIDS